MSEAPEIKNYESYNRRMELSMMDKMFFVDKIEPDMIVDFGCADAVLLKSIRRMKEVSVLGYDCDPLMAAHSTDEVLIYTTWNAVYTEIQKAKHPALVLSSVIHEVFHYGSKADIDMFWYQVLETGFEYIVIRDMIPARAIDRVSCVNDVKKVYHKFLGTKALDDFERTWGSIENNKQLIHFLLKYRYLSPNWEREVRENYMPVTRESVLAKIPVNYDIVFHEHYVLPYLLQTVRDDLGIEIKDPTHLKLILRKHK